MNESGQFGEPASDPLPAAIEQRLRLIERRLSQIEGSLAPQPTALATPPPPVGPRVAPPPPPQQQAHVVPPASRWDNAGTEEVLKWTGIGLVVAASAFLVNTVIDRGWVQPIHQLLLAVGVGLAFAWTASSWRDSRPRWSLAAGIGSVAILAVSAGAANRWLAISDIPAALSATVVIAAAGFGLAHRINRGSVAALSFIQLLLVPLWLDAVYRYDLAWSTAWVFAAIVGAVAVSQRTGWTMVRSATVTVVGLVLPAVLVDIGLRGTDTPWLVQSIISAAVAVVAVSILTSGETSTVGDSVSWEARLRPQFDHLGAVGLPAMWWLASFAFWASDAPTPLSDGWTSNTNYGVIAMAMAAATAAIVGLAGGQLARPGSVGPAASATATTMGLGALVLFLGGAGLALPGLSFVIVAVTVAAVGLLIVGLQYEFQVVTVIGAGAGLGVGLTMLAALAEAMATGPTLTEATSYLLTLALVAVSCWYFREPHRPLVGTVAGLTWVGFMMWLWAVLRPLSQGQMLVSLIYAVMGAAALVVARRMSASPDGGPTPTVAAHLPGSANAVAGLGLATLAATVVKLVTVDLVAVDTLWRSLLFFVVGFGLLRIGLSLPAIRQQRIPLR